MNITIGELGDAIIKVAAVIGAFGALYGLLMRGIKKIILPMRIKMLKSDLTTLFYLAESGDLSIEQRKLAYEEYDEYVNELKQDSWVHEKFESLHKEGKL